MNWLWPPVTGKTVLDTWSICHFCFWICIGYNWGALALKNKVMNPWWFPVIVTVVGALLWEVIEWQVFERLGVVRHPELWFNRWLSDPVVGVAGTLLGIWLVHRQ